MIIAFVSCASGTLAEERCEERVLAAQMRLATKLIDHLQTIGTVQTVPIQVDQRFFAIDLPNRASRYLLTPVTTRDAPARFTEFSAVTSGLGGSRYSRASVDIQLPKFVSRQTTEQYRRESA